MLLRAALRRAAVTVISSAGVCDAAAGAGGGVAAAGACAVSSAGACAVASGAGLRAGFLGDAVGREARDCDEEKTAGGNRASSRLYGRGARARNVLHDGLTPSKDRPRTPRGKDARSCIRESRNRSQISGGPRVSKSRCGGGVSHSGATATSGAASATRSGGSVKSSGKAELPRSCTEAQIEQSSSTSRGRHRTGPRVRRRR